jgi:hypothetical protein
MIGVGYGKSASETAEKFTLRVMVRLRLYLAQNPGTVRSDRNGVRLRIRWELDHDRAPGMLFLHQEVADDQRVHAGTEKRADGVCGRVHDRLATKIE